MIPTTMKMKKTRTMKTNPSRRSPKTTTMTTTSTKTRKTRETVTARDAASPSDPYYDLVVKHWPRIVALYRRFEDKRPVILYDVHEVRAYALPYIEFKAELSLASQ